MNNEPLPCRKFWSERVDRESGDIVYEAKEITINGASDSDLLNSSFIVFQGARAKEDCELFMQAVSRATPQIDVEKLKREVCETVTHNIQKVGAVYAVNVVSDIIDHLAAQYDFVPKNGGNTRAPLPRIDGLYDAISIEDILAPNTDKECDNIVKRYNDHRAIYGRDSSETLLEAARAYAKLQGSKV